MMETIRTNPTKIATKKFYDFVFDDHVKYNSIVVCGHTHNKMSGDYFINSGSWGQFRDFVELNDGKTLVISDLHIGDTNMSNIDIMPIELESLIFNQKYTEIILLGDVIDLWVTNGATFNKDYKWFVDLIGNVSKYKTVIWYIGNHDYDLQKYPNITLYLGDVNISYFGAKVYNNIRYYFNHGQDYDINSRSWPIKLFYYIWTPLGDNLWYIGKRLKGWALGINKKVK